MKYLITTIAALVLMGCGESKAYDLSGKWLGKNYRCGLSSTDQEISITQSGNKVVATKITGDDCVGAGQKTWEGIISGSQIKGSWYGKPPWEEKPTKYHDLDIRIENSDLLIWPDVGVTFERIKIPGN